jgi:hypothetical protein
VSSPAASSRAGGGSGAADAMSRKSSHSQRKRHGVRVVAETASKSVSRSAAGTTAAVVAASAVVGERSQGSLVVKGVDISAYASQDMEELADQLATLVSERNDAIGSRFDLERELEQARLQLKTEQQRALAAEQRAAKLADEVASLRALLNPGSAAQHSPMIPSPKRTT